MSEEGAKAKCSKGDLHVCVQLGMFYEDVGSYADAKKHCQSSCEKGEMEGCSRLGWLYEIGWGVERDRKRAVELTQKACDAGECTDATFVASCTTQTQPTSRTPASEHLSSMKGPVHPEEPRHAMSSAWCITPVEAAPEETRIEPNRISKELMVWGTAFLVTRSAGWAFERAKQSQAQTRIRQRDGRREERSSAQVHVPTTTPRGCHRPRRYLQARGASGHVRST